jgi:signal transduction histidine kinase
LPDTGEMAARIRAHDWSHTSLGPIDQWPSVLRHSVSFLLSSKAQIVLFWGPDLVVLYNDAYRPVFGRKHPWALGRPAREAWREVWDFLGPVFGDIVRTGEAYSARARPFFLERHAFSEETYFDVSYDPVRDDTGHVEGIYCIVSEVTGTVLGERRLAVLRALGTPAGGRQMHDVATHAMEMLGKARDDVPYAVLYLRDTDGTARAVAQYGATPTLTRLSLDTVAPIPAQVKPQLYVAGLPSTARPDLAVVVPFISGTAQLGLIVAGISKHLAFEGGYADFFNLVGSTIGAALTDADAFEAERRRSAALAELDRAKTAFFSNVSHEFRTPLTLMLGPTEEALRSPAHGLSGEDLEMLHRNELRLLKLVNALLDFARIEAGRMQGSYVATELSSFTAELAGMFRSAFERAGLEYVVRCDPLPELVYVDHVMWEHIVLNLVSNALKFTFEGRIEVSLRDRGDHVELSVSDTGIGIADEQMPRLFERFHRIEGAKARTHEGSGIGLALVNDLVRLHGGTITAESTPGSGTTFRVALPKGFGHLPADKINRAEASAEVSTRGNMFVQEALRWLPETAPRAAEIHPPSSVDADHLEGATLTLPSGHILIADDNADMRGYLSRLLEAHWSVETVPDGAAALSAATRRRPDLILTDVMMPRMDGFELLRRLRADVHTSNIPVLMLSARAGEDARVEGLQHGADDYLIKPFSARELIARVAGLLTQVRARKQMEEQAQALADAREEAERASRAKDEFLAMLGHELRNPLAPILTALQLMRLRGLQSREQDIIERQVGHLSRLVDDLLDVARITRGKVELNIQIVELADVVLRAMEIASPLLEQRQHQVNVSVPRTGLTVKADRDRLAQVIANLLTNAAKYSEIGSCIVVAAVRENGMVKLGVRDEGIGISPDMVQRIFDPFVQQPQTLDRSHGGLGLGLTIVRSLVQKHEGTVHVESDGLGHGSEFIVRLPAIDVRAAHEEVDSVDAAETMKSIDSSTRVLIVDDNADAAEMLKRALQTLGFAVEVAHDGPAALERCASFEPAIAVLDIGLPVMDGYEVARRLRSNCPEIRLIAVTGYGLESDRERSSSAGFDDHLVKPIDLGLLAKALAPRKTQV